MSTHVLRVYHCRPDGDYQYWGLHVWGAGVRDGTHWDHPLPQTGQTSEGCYWDIQLQGDTATRQVGLIVHKGDWKAAGIELQDLRADQREVWLVDGHDEALPNLGAARAKLGAINSRDGIITDSAAHWVADRLVLWRTNAVDTSGEAVTFKLIASSSAGITRSEDAVYGWDVSHAMAPLVPVNGSGGGGGGGGQGDPPAVREALARFPHLSGSLALQLDRLNSDVRDQLLAGQLCAAAFAPSGALLDVTMVQPQGVLDDRYFYDGALGDVDGKLRVWAPTAQSVELVVVPPQDASAHGYRSVHNATVVPMSRSALGCWYTERRAAWDKQLYLYRVRVFHPMTQKVETTLSTDPYSRCLTADGEYSMFVDLDRDEQLMPSGWAAHASPPLEDAVDTSVYELHIRDFSATDASVPPHLRGKYLAFDPASTGAPTRGQAHLQGLQDAGLTCIHLLPTYDFGSVPERASDQRPPPTDLEWHAPDSDQQQLAVSQVASVDAFNWGYDPVHYGVPEGSYATNPDSAERVKEFRCMVQGLHTMGLRVVLDVVYNHTFASGLNQHSVLDRVVPGYYHRRTERGDYCNSTCCNNTATEHLMCERLMIDDLVHWATHYRVDGFRFDIMGHVMLSSMRKARAALDGLTPGKHGVDGRSVYIYGEAWDFGEVSCNQRGRNASQLNIAGTGLGAFNDRMRDACIGGSPFAPPTMQGFLTGLSLDPNPSQGPASPDDRTTLATYGDWLKLGLAGNLREYSLTTANGAKAAGKQVLMGGTTPVAYCASPRENVTYLGCHDNETLFDNVVLKLNHDGSAEMVARVCQLAHGVVSVSQGVAFFHAGDDLLRSKSLDRDSYNSGDWFNAVDWSGARNNYGVGLPIAAKNADHWDVKGPLLAMTTLLPSPAVIADTGAFFRAMLRVRYSTRLFRLPTAEAIQEQVSFTNCGPAQVPGLIVMRVESSRKRNCVTDDRWNSVVVVLNATPRALTVDYPGDVKDLAIHPAMEGLPHVQGSRTDDDALAISVGARTFLVLCEQRRKNWFGW